MASGLDHDVRDRRPASWAAVIGVVGVVLATVLGGYAYVRSGVRTAIDPEETVEAYVRALSEADCTALADLSTAGQFDRTYCPAPTVDSELEKYALDVVAVESRERTEDSTVLLADVTVTYRGNGRFFTTAVAYRLVRDGGRWLVDEGRDPRPLIGDRSVRSRS